MRYVGSEPVLQLTVGLDRVGHLVEGLAQHTDRIIAFDARAGGPVAAAHGGGSSRDPVYRLGQAECERGAGYRSQ